MTKITEGPTPDWAPDIGAEVEFEPNVAGAHTPQGKQIVIGFEEDPKSHCSSRVSLDGRPETFHLSWFNGWPNDLFDLPTPRPSSPLPPPSIPPQPWAPKIRESRRLTSSPVLDAEAGRPKLDVIFYDRDGSVQVRIEGHIMPVRYQYVHRPYDGAVRRSGVFVAAFDKRGLGRFNARVGWSLANLNSGDEFDRRQAIKMAVHRAFRPMGVHSLPPSMLIPALFFGVSVTRDCVRMNSHPKIGCLAPASDVPGNHAVIDQQYPYPDFVEIAGLVPTEVDVRYTPWNITNMFIDTQQSLRSWTLPVDALETIQLLVRRLNIPLGQAEPDSERMVLDREKLDAQADYCAQYPDDTGLPPSPVSLWLKPDPMDFDGSRRDMFLSTIARFGRLALHPGGRARIAAHTKPLRLFS